MAIIPTDRKVKVDVSDSAPLDNGSEKKKQPKAEIKLNKTGDVLVNDPKLDSLKEEKSKTVAMLFGRMNPPTKGHEENVEGLKKLAKDHNADHVVIASHSHDGEKNPLSPEQKLKHLQRAFPDTNVKTSSKAQPTILHHAAELHKQGYKHLIVAGGGDRAEEYKKLLHKYNGVEGRHGHYNFDSIEVKSTGERKEGVSGSDMRKHVKSGNFDKFREGLPSKIRDNEAHAKELFHDVKGGLKEYYERVGRLIERFIKSSKPAPSEKEDDLPFTPDKPHKPVASAGKFGLGYSTARHLARQGMKTAQTHQKEETDLEEAFLHDPDTYLRMATQAREQGKILRAALLTRIAAAVRRRDTATAMTLRRSLPATQE